MRARCTDVAPCDQRCDQSRRTRLRRKARARAEPSPRSLESERADADPRKGAPRKRELLFRLDDYRISGPDAKAVEQPAGSAVRKLFVYEFVGGRA